MHPDDDIDRIMAVMATAFHSDFGEAWTRSQVESALLIGNCHYQLIGEDGTAPDDGDRAVGFALLRRAYDEEEMLLLAVDPSWRRRGLATKLLRSVKADAQSRQVRRLLLEMRDGNSAESLYLANGFVRVGRRQNYYRSRNGTGIAAITFSCKLD